MRHWLAIVVTLLMLSGCDQRPIQIHLSGHTMGTTYSIKYLQSSTVRLQANPMHQAIDTLLGEINHQMSTYLPQSELSRFNQSRSTSPFPVSPELMRVIKEAQRISAITNGAMDITVGPLVNLWGFGPQAKPEIIPTQQQLDQARTWVGMNHLKTGPGNVLTKDIPELYIDLSSIAKGLGVDEVGGLLSQYGVTDYMVEIGGEIHTRGKNQNGLPWRIAIEKPVAGERAVERMIAPGNHGVATSGDYRRYFEENGHRYSHIIHPLTGRPVDNNVVSVTVIAPSTMTADGLATGLMVLGEKKALAVAEQHDIAMLMIVKTDQGFREVMSSPFTSYLAR